MKRHYEASMSEHVGENAVVIGAGMAGLSAAMSVAGFFRTVTLVERDVTTPGDEPRPGVPQGRHPHVLTSGGLRALQDLFPGIGGALIEAGAIPLSGGWDIRQEIPGIGVLPKRAILCPSFAVTRPVLERVVSQRLAAQTNVAIRRGVRALEIVTAPDGARVTGLRVEDENGEVEDLDADLVIDASGRIGLIAVALEASGRPLPRCEAIGVDIGYSTGIFRIPNGADLDFAALVTFADAPRSGRSGYLVKIADNVWQALLVGRGGDQPPGDIDGFLAFARGLATFSLSDALKNALRPSELARFRFRESVRWRFGAGSMPAGLLPIGDSLCRFNPIYGQGMAVAAQEAGLLRRLLESSSGRRDEPLSRLTDDFLGQCEALVDAPWAISAIPDFLHPSTIGDRPHDLDARIQTRGELLRSAIYDEAAHRSLLEAQHLLPRGFLTAASPLAADSEPTRVLN
jgi:2-polyprenyl-6-methoxyphenol hydroxylase-like FAD-dependent oxidoreductase